MLVEGLVVAVAVDDDQVATPTGDDVEFPRAGMPVRLADTTGLQRERQEAGLLTFQDRKVVLVGLLEPTPSCVLLGEAPRWNRCDCDVIVSAGRRRVTAKARSVIGHWDFLVRAIAGAGGDDQAVNAYTGCGRGACWARSPRFCDD